jgi:tetratricopeptide (TPR) repeat protein
MGAVYEEHVEAVSRLKEAESGFSSGDYERARSASDECVSIDPSLGRAWEILGFAALREGDLYSALGHMQMALSCKGGFEDARSAFEALEGLGDLSATDPAEADQCLLALGSSLLKQRRYEAALPIYDGLLSRAESWEHLSTVGFLRRELGLLEGSLEAYERALEMDGAPPEILSDLSVVLIKLGRLEEAEGALSSCLEAGLQKPNIMNNLGFVREAMEDLEGALDAYDQAIEMDGRYYPALYSKGRILQKMGRMPESRVYMDRALELEGRVYRLEDVTGRKEREDKGGIHAKELMPSQAEGDN